MNIIENNNSSEMSVNNNSVVFQLILDKLYRNPIDSIVRELSCNAIDIQKLNDINTRFFIQEPSVEYPSFIIRDFGTGLSPNQVEKELNTLLFSTKTDCSVSSGGYGVGSKSPFSLVETYNMTSFFLGTKYDYVWTLNKQNSTPILTLVSEEPTTEPNGLLIDIPLRNMSIRSLAEWSNAINLLSFATIPPRVFKNIGDMDSEKTIDLKCTRILSNVKAYERNYQNYIQFSYLRVGEALYPISFLNSSREMSSKMSFLSNLAPNLTVILDIPVKTLKIHSSREFIITSRENEDILKSILDDCVQEYLQSLLEKGIDLRDKTLLSGEDLKEILKTCNEKEEKTLSFNVLRNLGIEFQNRLSQMIQSNISFYNVYEKYFNKKIVSVNSSSLRFFKNALSVIPTEISSNYIDLCEHFLEAHSQDIEELCLGNSFISYKEFKTEISQYIPKKEAAPTEALNIPGVYKAKELSYYPSNPFRFFSKRMLSDFLQPVGNINELEGSLLILQQSGSHLSCESIKAFDYEHVLIATNPKSFERLSRKLKKIGKDFSTEESFDNLKINQDYFSNLPSFVNQDNLKKFIEFTCFYNYIFTRFFNTNNSTIKSSIPLKEIYEKYLEKNGREENLITEVFEDSFTPEVLSNNTRKICNVFEVTFQEYYDLDFLSKTILSLIPKDKLKTLVSANSLSDRLMKTIVNMYLEE